MQRGESSSAIFIKESFTMSEKTKIDTTQVENTTTDTTQVENTTTDQVENTTTENIRDKNLVLMLKRPFEFEGKKIDEIDLNGLEDLTGKTMRKIDKIFRSTGGAATYSKEVDSYYLQLVAMEATGLPQELFDKLHAKDVTALEIKVRNFLIV
jgi:hypothetical protein